MIENRFKPYKIHVFVYFEDKYAHHAWRHGFTLYQDMHMNIKGGGGKILKSLILNYPPFSWSLDSENIKISSELTWEVLPLETLL